MPGESAKGPLPGMTPAQLLLAGKVRRDVEHLAGEIGERNTRKPEQLRVADTWLGAQLAALNVGPIVHQPYMADGVVVANMWVDVRGSGAADGAPGPSADEIIVIGAHYDSFPGSPAANDNASGVAAVLAIGRALAALPREQRPARTVRLALFTNEEPPYFWTELMGSLVMARSFHEWGERIVAMLTPETIGCYFDAPGTQKYPPPLGLFYPSAGDFIAFIGLSGSRGASRLVKRCVGEFRSLSPMPSMGTAMPGWVPGVGSSDHWSFNRMGVPSLMITDTAPFRYAYYHTPEDTPDKIDYERMARVVEGLSEVVCAIAAGGAI